MSRLASLITTLVERTTATATTSTDGASSTETRRYAEPSALEVETRNGRVDVRGEDREDVAVTITKRARTESALEDVDVRATGGEADGQPLRLAAVLPNPVAGAAVEFDVRVPAGLPVDRIETVNGRIAVRDVGGDPRLRTKNGRVDARTVAGFVDLRGTNGRLVAREVDGIDGAKTVNGAIDLEVDAIRGETIISASNGSIDLLAGPELDAAVSLETTVGRIEASAFGESASGIGGSAVTGTLGDGRHRLAVSSVAGSLEFDLRA